MARAGAFPESVRIILPTPSISAEHRKLFGTKPVVNHLDETFCEFTLESFLLRGVAKIVYNHALLAPQTQEFSENLDPQDFAPGAPTAKLSLLEQGYAHESPLCKLRFT
jgi:hypothetical protein